MSDLGGRSAGNGQSGSRGPAPQGTGSPSGVRGPRDIMRDRQAREARRKAEQDAKEALELARAQEESRLEEERRRSAERRAAAAAGAARQGADGGQRGSGGTTGQRLSDNSQRDRRSGGRTAGGPDQPLQGVGSGGRALGGDNAGTSRPRPTQSQNQPRPVPGESSRTRPQAEAGPSTGAPPVAQPGSAMVAPTRSSFPHAFERWETLSAHWEGLTSFWLRRLEENSNEINKDPLNQQLGRQVTDLSAAGANLFHAVVELQRLRASSERKFQRWFFETRAEQERSQEIQAMLEGQLEQERRQRAADAQQAAADLQAALAGERERSNNELQVREMRRELQIAKDEARRAWDELGRREQEERERTASLREGLPTLVGGVQVVPMMQGVPSRHGSAREREQPPTRDGPSTSVAPSNFARQQPEAPVEESEPYQQYSRAQRAEPADPFTEAQQRGDNSAAPYASPPPPIATHPAFTQSQPYTQAPAVQPASTSTFYQQQQGTLLHPTEAPYGEPSEAAFSEEEYEIDATGQFTRDAAGNKVRYRAPAEQNSDDEDDAYDEDDVERERELAFNRGYGVSGVEYGRGPTTTTSSAVPPQGNPTIGEPVDYSGTGYGSAAPEWAAVPRHHHPTRLSDVLEEDERSRTSASQVSRRD